jgi:hypothetical protein
MCKGLFTERLQKPSSAARRLNRLLSFFLLLKDLLHLLLLLLVLPHRPRHLIRPRCPSVSDPAEPRDRLKLASVDDKAVRVDDVGSDVEELDTAENDGASASSGVVEEMVVVLYG